MSTSADMPSEARGGAFAPLREKTFRTIWTASVFSNFGQLILGVGAAWEMTQLTNSPSMVALVQSALMIPLMLVALPAGAIADMFDRRKIALSGLGFAVLSSTVLTALAFLGMTTPWVLLGFLLLVGAGVALYSPSWQASIGEQVSQQNLPQAIALGTISYNIARSFGPALGGLIVLAFGAKAAFALNATLYIPLWLAFFFWTRRHTPSRLPPERIDRAIIAGARYALHSPPVRVVLIRALVFGFTTATGSALAPLVAKTLLAGNAGVYGILLGVTGIGAVLGAVFVGDIRHRMSTETAVRILTAGGGVSLIVIGFSHNLWITCAAFFVMGACSILHASALNVTVQLAAPRWVTARALSLYSSAMTGGVALGAWVWGMVATQTDIAFAMIASGIAAMATVALGLLFPLQEAEEIDTSSVDIGYEPEVALGVTLRSGPIVVEVEYDVDTDQAREFYNVMVRLRRARNRIGAFDWSISRDIADPTQWVERYHCPTWGDYLRMRDRYTQAEFELQELADSFNRTGHGHRVRRRLERPFGSVRWKADSPDPYRGTVGYLGP